MGRVRLSLSSRDLGETTEALDTLSQGLGFEAEIKVAGKARFMDEGPFFSVKGYRDSLGKPQCVLVRACGTLPSSTFGVLSGLA